LHTQIVSSPSIIDPRCLTCAGAGTIQPETLTPHGVEEPHICIDCGGSGERNYLAEAFRIAAGKSSLICERPHLVAIVNHCRDLTSAALILPEVA
jgi:hypothetical protein